MKKLIILLFVFFNSVGITKEASQSSYLTEEILDKFVSQMRSKLPISGPDGTKIISINRQNRTLIYGMYQTNNINQESTDLLFNSQYKIILCRQESEAYMLKRKVNLTWNYFNKHGKYLATASITPSDCGY